MALSQEHTDDPPSGTQDVLGQALETIANPAETTPLFVQPTAADLRQLASRYVLEDQPPAVSHLRILTHERTLEEAIDDQLTALGLASAVTADALTIRVLQAESDAPRQRAQLSPLVLTEQQVAASVRPGVVTDTDADYVNRVEARYERLWERATLREHFARMPSIEQVTEAGQDLLSDAFVDDLFDALEHVGTLGATADPIDLADVVFGLAAKHEVTQYMVGEFCEAAGLMSKAKISRTKSFYEDVGLMGTERVPQDVGRPRNRPVFADDTLQSADVATLLERLIDVRQKNSV